VALALVIAPAGTTVAGPQIRTQTPIRDFSVPTFNDAGFRTMQVRGREAILLGASEAELRDVTITLFSGDASARVDTVFLSSAARLLSEERRVTGSDVVRVLGQGFELKGVDWEYRHSERRLLVKDGVRVVFQLELRDVLR
jgi:hypothetical protein